MLSGESLGEDLFLYSFPNYLGNVSYRQFFYFESKAELDTVIEAFQTYYSIKLVLDNYWEMPDSFQPSIWSIKKDWDDFAEYIDVRYFSPEELENNLSEHKKYHLNAVKSYEKRIEESKLNYEKTVQESKKFFTNLLILVDDK